MEDRGKGRVNTQKNFCGRRSHKTAGKSFVVAGFRSEKSPLFFGTFDERSSFLEVLSLWENRWRSEIAAGGRGSGGP